MFFYKKETKPSQVKCETCKHWVDKADCQEVIVVYSSNIREIERYCPIHKVGYDKKKWGYKIPREGENHCRWGIRYYKTIPAHEVEVDEEGKEITKKK